MKQITRLILGMIALLLLTSCGQDPRKQAEANRIEAESSIKANDALQNRQHADELHDLEVNEIELKQARIEATQAKRIAALGMMWDTFKIFGSVSLAVALLAVAWSVARTSYGLSNVAVEAAGVRANLIPLDRETRQFPLLRQVHGSKYALHNPNTGSVLMLDTQREEDRQMISAMGATQLYGTVAHEAAGSANEAIPMMRLPIIHSTETGLAIGETFIADAIPLPSEIQS